MGLFTMIEKAMLYATSFPGSADFVARRLTEIDREEAGGGAASGSSDSTTPSRCPFCGEPSPCGHPYCNSSS